MDWVIGERVGPYRFGQRCSLPAHAERVFSGLMAETELAEGLLRYDVGDGVEVHLMDGRVERVFLTRSCSLGGVEMMGLSRDGLVIQLGSFGLEIDDERIGGLDLVHFDALEAGAAGVIGADGVTLMQVFAAFDEE